MTKEKAHANPSQISNPEQAWKTVIRECQEHRAVEVVAIISLNGKLARALEGLVDRAVRDATNKKKPDTKLLRLIVRYAGTVTRRMPGLSKPSPIEEVTEEELRATK